MGLEHIGARLPGVAGLQAQRHALLGLLGHEEPGMEHLFGHYAACISQVSHPGRSIRN